MSALAVDPAVAGLSVACGALLFAMAAVHKLRDPQEFAAIFAAYRVLPFTPGPVVAALVPLLEALVCVGLLLNGSRRAAAGVGAGLLVLYAGAIAVNLLRGRRDLTCGCGAPGDGRPIAGWLVWRNLALAAFLSVSLLPVFARQLVLTDAVTITFGTVACALVYLCLDTLLGRPAVRSGHSRDVAGGG